jgi:solute carrier family 25 (mitochondrial carrier protein), member 16
LGPDPFVKHADKFFAGAGAGLTAVTLTYPLDTIRARLAFQVTGEHKYNGILQCATAMLKEEGGVRALYRGFVPTLTGMVPYAGLSFYCFEVLKYACMKYTPNATCSKLERNTGELQLSINKNVNLNGYLSRRTCVICSSETSLRRICRSFSSIFLLSI